MSIKLKKEHLQNDKYNYTWSRDEGDSAYTGVKDRIRIDKDEGYEVLYFIQSFLNEYNLKDTIENVHIIEDALQHSSRSSMVMRNELNSSLKNQFNL